MVSNDEYTCIMDDNADNSVELLKKENGLNIRNNSLRLSITSDKDAKLNLFDVQGKLMVSKNIQEGSNHISLLEYPSGIYIYSIEKDGEVINGRLMK